MSQMNIPPEFDSIRDEDETILWSGQPKLVPFLMLGVPFLIIGLIWGAFDYFFFLRNTMFGGFGMMSGFFNVFILIHMFPLYAGILNMLRLILVHKNTRYAATNKRLMFRTGFFGIDIKAVDYDKVQNIEVNVNPLEKLFNVGTIKVFTGEFVQNGNHGSRSVSTDFVAIEDPYGTFKTIKKLIVDIKTDWNYPNQLRPEDNPGYTTKYTPKK